MDPNNYLMFPWRYAFSKWEWGIKAFLVEWEIFIFWQATTVSEMFFLEKYVIFILFLALGGDFRDQNFVLIWLAHHS